MSLPGLPVSLAEDMQKGLLFALSEDDSKVYLNILIMLFLSRKMLWAPFCGPFLDITKQIGNKLGAPSRHVAPCAPSQSDGWLPSCTLRVGYIQTGQRRLADSEGVQGMPR